MLFNSLAFVFFLPIIFIGFFLLPIKWRSTWMLLASYYFYFSWSYWMGLLLLATTLFDWWIGLKIEGSQSNKRSYLMLSLLFNLGLLIGFKYIGGFEYIAQLFSAIEVPNYNAILNSIAIPIGISFYTFQSLSYVFDVYYGKIAAEKRLEKYALYVSFFPQLVAGPIERYQHLSEQFTFKIKLTEVDFRTAAQKIIYGFFKKLVIADRVGEYVDIVFSSPEKFHPLLLLIAGIGFAVQVNCDFSGYTDIAAGVAKLFGVDLMINFKRPLLATSFKAFWQKHHISFMNWFRDYVYFPLGGNKKGQLIWIRNILIVFVLSGLWHGAKLNLLIWGILLAFIFILENHFLSKTKISILKKIGGHFYFIILHSLLIILVRSASWKESELFYKAIFSDNLFQVLHFDVLFQQMNAFSLWLTLVLVLLFFVKETIDEEQETSGRHQSALYENWIHALLFMLIFIAGRFDTHLFIYFQF
jgi:alginate O-acetyltransferase complex protein AlgI